MELDDINYDIINIKLYGYNSVKKRCLSDDKTEIFYLGSKFKNLNIFDRQNITFELLNKYMQDVKHVAFEGYAFGFSKSKQQQSQRLVQLGEFIGGMKKMFYDQGKGIIIYSPRTIKRFATGKGNAEKVTMCKMFEREFPKYYPNKIFNQLPQYKDPHSDLCDAFWICETLRNHIIFEKLGESALDPGIVAFLTQKSTKNNDSIIETKLYRKEQ